MTDTFSLNSWRKLCEDHADDNFVVFLCTRQILADDDFNKLKEDLIWEGSNVAYLNRNETLFLSAMSAYLKGETNIFRQ